MRHLFKLPLVVALLGSPAFADPPAKGFVGALAYATGVEPERFACDRLDLVRTIYETGDLYKMRPKFDQLVQTLGVYGEPQCLIARLGQVKVLDAPIFLGPIGNPVGDAQLAFWAVHVDNSPKGGTADYWVLYLDTAAEPAGL
jgi:hypothetical protein